MKISILSNRWSTPHFGVNGTLRSPTKVLLTVVALVALLSMSLAAKADSYDFSVHGSGVKASGVIQVSNTGPLGAYTVTGITGTFSDLKNGHFGSDHGSRICTASDVQCLSACGAKHL